MLTLALVIGIMGNHFVAGLSWVDSILEASMILTGMGPVATLTSTACAAALRAFYNGPQRERYAASMSKEGQA